MFDTHLRRCKFESRWWSQHTTVGVIDPLRPRSQCFEVERKRTRPQISPFIWSKKTSAASWHKKQFLNSFSKIFCFPNKSFWKWIFRIKICEILYFGFVLKKFVWLLPKYLVILANHKKTTLRSFDYFESTNVEYFKVLKHALKKIIDEIQ